MKDIIKEFSACVIAGEETVFITPENEDSLKLTQNYDGLVQQYSPEISLFTYTNPDEVLEEIMENQRVESTEKMENQHAEDLDEAKMAKDTQENVVNVVMLTDLSASMPAPVILPKKTVLFPITLDCRLLDKTIEVSDHANKIYQPPEIVTANEDALFLAHSQSNVYDGTNIRVDKWGLDENGVFVIETSRTTYFKSLLTNRAIDFQLPQETTLRMELFDKAYDLENSQLSNHLGFNGWVRSADGYYPFTKRGKKLSMGKNTYGNSVNASLKTAYALERGRRAG